MKTKEISIRSITHVNLEKFLKSVKEGNSFSISVFDQESYDGETNTLNIQIIPKYEDLENSSLLWLELDYDKASELSSHIVELTLRNTLREELEKFYNYQKAINESDNI